MNGLSLTLSVCRRSLDDQPHFHEVAALYKRHYFHPGKPVDQKAFDEELRSTLDEYMRLYAISGETPRAPDVVATMSHYHRLLMNALLNAYYAHQQGTKQWLPWTRGLLEGATMQPQSCYVWPGMVVCGCTRSSANKTVVNGLFYLIESYGPTSVELIVHPEYNKGELKTLENLRLSIRELERTRLREIVSFLLELPRTLDEYLALEGMADTLSTGLDTLDVLASMGIKACRARSKKKIEYMSVPEYLADWAQDLEGALEIPAEVLKPASIELLWDEFQETLRLTHALPYVYYQGKTLANLTLWLMNVKSKHFTMRHLIMGLGRVQKAKFVKICGPGREKMLLAAAQEAFDGYEKRAQDEMKEAAEAAEAAGEALMAQEDFEEGFDENELMEIQDPFADVDFDD